MTAIRHWSRSVVLAVLPATLCATIVSGADQVPSLEEIRHSQKSIEAAGDKMYIKFHVSNQYFASPAIVRGIFGSDTSLSSISGTAAFKGPMRFYEQTFVPELGTKPPANTKKSVMSFDGHETRIYFEPAVSNPKAGLGDHARIWPGDRTDQFAVADQFMAYQGHPKAPYPIFADNRDVGPFRLPDTLADGEYAIEPELKPATDGVPCAVAKSRKDRIWFDPKIGLAIRQREWLADGGWGVALRLRFEDFAQVTPGIWYAKTIHGDYFADPAKHRVRAGEPFFTETVRATELRLDPVPDDLFVAHLPPGTFVEDMTKFPASPEKGYPTVTYSVPDVPADLERVIALATAERASHGHGRGATRRTTLLLGLNAAVLVVMGAVWLYRRGRVADHPRGISA